MESIKLIVCLLLIVTLIIPTFSELFSSIIHMKNLIHTTDLLANSLDAYLRDRTHALELSETFPFLVLLPYLRQVPKNSTEEIETFLSNPINSFLLIKRLTLDWQNVKNILRHKQNGENFIKEIESNVTFPLKEDLYGAEDAFTRLQKTYRLDVNLLSNGIIYYHNAKTSETIHIAVNTSDAVMNFDDCYEIGEYFHRIGNNNNNALEWMRLSLAKLSDERETITIRERIQISILANLAHYSFLAENFDDAIRYNDNVLSIDPNDSNAIENKRHYESEINRKAIIEENLSQKTHLPQQQNNYTAISEHSFYQICRGENRLHPRVESRLMCYFLDTTLTPYYRLSRIKVELKHTNPDIVVYHDIISDSEINFLKLLAAPNLVRGQTHYGDVTAAVNDRIVKISWFNDTRHEVIKKLTHRIGLITGLDMNSSESLQIGNYGIGGHFVPHLDAGPDERYGTTTERIATWMFYLSDVEAGGDTAFVNLNVTAKPIKGAALFWYNLLKSGTVDNNTMHAGCPVLVGNKWIANKWIHASGQEFKRKCGATTDE